MPLWRVAHRACAQLGLLGGVHHRDQQGLCTQLQVLLDQGGVCLGQSHDGLGAQARQAGTRAGDCLQLRQHRAQVVGAVLAIDHQPVIANTSQQLGAQAIGQIQPKSKLRLTLTQGQLEGV